MKEEKVVQKAKKKSHKTENAIAALIIGAAVGSIATYVISQQKKRNGKSKKAKQEKRR